MHYPWWYVPHLTAPMLIAVVAVVHVMVSHYAVGGGLFLAVETATPIARKDRAYLDYLRRHAAFFVLLTVVFGAITGVGIWWTIGLASPLATEVLIRTFVFGWAMEYVFFVLEIVSAFIFYYYWGRLTPSVHAAMGWIYAVAAWMSLVLITGITAFMLDPGAWLVRPRQLLGRPSSIRSSSRRSSPAPAGPCCSARCTCICTRRFRSKDPRLHDLIQARSARPALLGAVLVTVGGVVWYLVPARVGQGRAGRGGRAERVHGPDLRPDGRGVRPLVPRAVPAIRAGSRPALPPSCCYGDRGLQHRASSSARRCASRT